MASSSAPRATRTSPRSPRRRRRSAARSRRSGPSRCTRGHRATSACGWASTRARSRSRAATTTASRSTAPPGWPRSLMAARCSSRPRRAPSPRPATAIGFRDLGEHRLKDITRTERLYQVEAAGLAVDFPPPRSLEVAPPGNLPTQLTTFVGRAEVAAAQALLDRHAPAHAHGPRRDRQDPPVDRPRDGLPRALPRRRLVRGAGRRDRPGADRVVDRGIDRAARHGPARPWTSCATTSPRGRSCSCSTTSSSWSRARRSSRTCCGRRPG